MGTAARARIVGRWIFALFFVTAGASHFLRPAMFVAIVPPYLPSPEALVYVSGAAEVILGTLLLVRRWSSLAGWGLIALLIAVFPANIHMAMNAAQYSSIPAWALWLRLPLQGVLIAAAYVFARSRGQSRWSVAI